MMSQSSVSQRLLLSTLPFLPAVLQAQLAHARLVIVADVLAVAPLQLSDDLQCSEEEALAVQLMVRNAIAKQHAAAVSKISNSQYNQDKDGSAYAQSAVSNQQQQQSKLQQLQQVLRPTCNALQLLLHGRDVCGKRPFTSIAAVAEREVHQAEHIALLSTGCATIDDALIGRERMATEGTAATAAAAAVKGGVQRGELTEIVGVPGSGKTQLLMQMCFAVHLQQQQLLQWQQQQQQQQKQKPGHIRHQHNNDRAHIHTVFIDTEHSFMPDRAAAIALAMINRHRADASNYSISNSSSSSNNCNRIKNSTDLTVKDLMSGVAVIKVFTRVQLLSCLHFLQHQPLLRQQRAQQEQQARKQQEQRQKEQERKPDQTLPPLPSLKPQQLYFCDHVDQHIAELQKIKQTQQQQKLRFPYASPAAAVAAAMEVPEKDSDVQDTKPDAINDSCCRCCCDCGYSGVSLVVVDSIAMLLRATASFTTITPATASTQKDQQQQLLQQSQQFAHNSSSSSSSGNESHLIGSVNFTSVHEFNARMNVLRGTVAALKAITEHNNNSVAVVMSNHITTSFNKNNYEPNSVSLIPALGETWTRSIPTRLLLAWQYAHNYAAPRNKNQVNTGSSMLDRSNNMLLRTATMMRSSYGTNISSHNNSEARYSFGISVLYEVTEAGVVDISEHRQQQQQQNRQRLGEERSGAVRDATHGGGSSNSDLSPYDDDAPIDGRINYSHINNTNNSNCSNIMTQK